MMSTLLHINASVCTLHSSLSMAPPSSPGLRTKSDNQTRTTQNYRPIMDDEKRYRHTSPKNPRNERISSQEARRPSWQLERKGFPNRRSNTFSRLNSAELRRKLRGFRSDSRRASFPIRFEELDAFLSSRRDFDADQTTTMMGRLRLETKMKSFKSPPETFLPPSGETGALHCLSFQEDSKQTLPNSGRSEFQRSGNPARG